MSNAAQKTRLTPQARLRLPPLPSLGVTALVLFTVVAILSGCALGPDYRRPPASPRSTVVNIPAEFLTSVPIDSDPAWWRDFHEPLLDRLVTQASTNNHDWQRAEARLREARALWTAARFDYVPAVRAAGGYDQTQISRAAAGTKERQSELYRAEFDATWELDLWGRVRRSVEAARATVEAVAATRDEVLVSIQAEVAANYLELRGTQAHLEVATRNATNQSQTLDLAIALRDGGQGTQLDVARARSLLNETLASIPPLETSVQRAIHRISVLCGLPPTSLSTELSPRRNPPAIPAQLSLNRPTELLRSRPDVRAAEQLLAAATAGIGVETAELFPRVTFSGSLGLQAGSLGDLTAPGADIHSFGLHLSWAALDLGRVRQRIKAADARAQAALAAYEQTVLLALEETENSLVSLNRERQRLTYLTEAERAAGEAVALARQRYRDGIADYLSVLDAERTLLNLQEQLVSSQTLSALRLVSVYKAFAAGRKSE